MVLQRPAVLLIVALAFLLVDAHVFTALIPGFGLGLFWYNWTFALLTVLGLAAWPLLKRRRVTSLGLSVTGTVMLATGAVLLYAGDRLLRADLKDWLVYWHAAWSWAFLLFLVAHLARNRVRGLDFAHAFLARRGATALFALTWSVGVALAAWTLLAPGAGHALARDGHAARVTLTVLAAGVAGAAAWSIARARFRRACPGAAPRERAVATRRYRRVLTDAWLFTAALAAIATGFLVLYVDAWLRPRGAFTAGLYWHSVTSGILLLVVLAHVTTNRRPLNAHARRVGREVKAVRWPGTGRAR